MNINLITNEFNKHYHQIQNGGFIIFYQKTTNFFLKFYKIIFFLIAIFLLFLFFLISIFKNIKIGKLRTDKIGEFAIRAEIYLLKNKRNKDLHIIFKDKKICNSFLFNLYKKKIFFFPNIIFQELYGLIIFLNLNKFIYNGPNDNIDTNFLLKKTKSQISIPIKLKQNLNEFQKKIISQKKIVCINIRDNFYYGRSSMSEYRNADIRHCTKAIKYLIKKGYFVIRMGRQTKNKLKINSKFFFDYSQSNLKNDAMDVFIAEACSFCITSGSGFDSVTRIFRKPTLFVNFLPYVFFTSDIYNSQVIFKKAYTKKSQRKNLKLKEILKSGIGNLQSDYEIKKMNVFFKENNPSEILSAVKEFEVKFKKSELINLRYDDLDKQFKNIYQTELKYTKFIENHKTIAASVPRFFLKEII